MAETDIKIKDAPLTGSISGSMKMPISDGSDLPRTTSVTQLYNFVKNGLLNTDGFALEANIPTKTSQLTNNSGFITEAALVPYAKTANVPTKTSQLTNDSSFATTSQIPTAVSKLTNDSGFITEAALAPYAKTANVPTKVSQLTNDSKFVSSDVTDALAKNVAENTGDIERLVEAHDTLGHAEALSLDLMNLPTVVGVPWFMIKEGAPSTTPVFIGQIYLDKTNKKVYFAFDVSSASDWIVLN